MHDRCRLPSHQAWKNYGARGITVCERWATFENFWADMGPTYQHGLTIERCDNGQGYDFSNCYWATYEEQANNTRRNRRLQTARGNLTIAQTADHAGIKRSTLYARIDRDWPAHDLFIPADLANRYRNRFSTS
jgi:hypothetical protein